MVEGRVVLEICYLQFVNRIFRFVQITRDYSDLLGSKWHLRFDGGTVPSNQFRLSASADAASFASSTEAENVFCLKLQKDIKEISHEEYSLEICSP